MLARSHTDVAGFGEMSISYLKENLGITNFGVLFPNDAYGQGFQQVSNIFLQRRDFVGNIIVLKLIYLPLVLLCGSLSSKQRRGTKG